jgi:hypothetical protein
MLIDLQRMKKLLLDNQKCESGGRLKFKIHVLSYGDNSWTVALIVIQLTPGAETIMDIQVLFESLFCSTKILNMATE